MIDKFHLILYQGFVFGVSGVCGSNGSAVMIGEIPVHGLHQVRKDWPL